MLLGILLMSASATAAIPQLVPSDPTVCETPERRDDFYKEEAGLMPSHGSLPPGFAEGKARAKEEADRFFKRLDALAAEAKWSPQQKADVGDRIYHDPNIIAMRSEPTKLVIKMVALERAVAADAEPQRCRDFVDFLRVTDDLNNSDLKTLEAMNALLDAEAKKAGVALK